MPFKSKAQRRWMYANKPEMAKEWEAKTPKGKPLPERVKPLPERVKAKKSKKRTRRVRKTR